MSAPDAANTRRASTSRRRALVGRNFLNPAFDYLLIGGGLSLLVTAGVWVMPGLAELPSVRVGDEVVSALPWVLLLCNSAHFASSTVRLSRGPPAPGPGSR